MKYLVNFFVFIVFLLNRPVVEAKDLTNRLGVGVKQENLNLTSLMIHYFPTQEYTWTGSVGLDTLSQASQSVLSIGLRRQIFFEDNLNFFGAGRISLLSSETNGQSESGFALAALSGVEFFLPGLENLGFQTEFGIEMSSLSHSRFKTVGGSFINTGIIFYF